LGIEIIKDREQWDRFVDGSPYGTIFHRWDLLAIVEKHTGFRFLPYGVTRGDELIALLPLFTRKMFGVGMITSPPPKAGIPNMGLVVPGSYDSLTQRNREQLLEVIGTELTRELDRLDPDYFSMVLPLGFMDVRIFQWLGFDAVPQYSYSFDLNRSLDDIFTSFKNKRRTAIRNAEKAGYSFRVEDGVSELYGLLKGRFEELGKDLAIPGEEYLRDLSSGLPSHIRVYSVRDGEKAVAAGMVSTYKDMKFLYWAAEQKGNVNDLLAWRLIQAAKNEGFPSVELVGANTRHLSLYKNQFSPDLVFSFLISRKNLLARAAETMYGKVRN
jgi:Acetyltransferase (GNAT) domain